LFKGATLHNSVVLGSCAGDRFYLFKAFATKKLKLKSKAKAKN